MTEDEQRALSAVRFNWAWTPDDVWGQSPFHVEGMHAEVERVVLAGVRDAKVSAKGSPIGLVLQGQRGAGKTHLLGWVRRQVQREGGYFFLVDLDQANPFWVSTQLSIRRDLLRANENGESQLTTLLRRLAALAGLSPQEAATVTGERSPAKEDVDELVMALRRVDAQVALECQDTLRALVLYASPEISLTAIGEDFLSSLDEPNEGERAAWGIRPRARAPQRIVRDVSWLLALTGPAVIAVDQIDFLVKRSAGQNGQSGYLSLAQVAEGLMALRENTRRTMSLVACIAFTWQSVKEKTVATATDRFREVRHLIKIPDPRVARELVTQRLAVPYAEVSFVPPRPTWPVAEHAFHGIEGMFTPRSLLQRVDAHVQQCLRTGQVSELDSLDSEPEALDEVAPQQHDLEPLDRRFADLKRHADVRSALDPAAEDHVVPDLLVAGLTAWMAEHSDSGVDWTIDPPAGGKAPALHARLRRTLDEETEDEAHWAFRAVAHLNGRAVQARLRNARTESGLRPDGTRDLIILRNSHWPGGPKTSEQIAMVKDNGGRALPVTDDDLRTFYALKTLLQDKPPGLESWLLARKPASRTELLDTVLAKQVDTPLEPPPAPAPDDDLPRAAEAWTPPEAAAAEQAPVAAAEDDPLSVVIGENVADGTPVRVALESLRKHTAIFAGTGSGKTVLIRRLVEECALRGVSSIVLDPNNDLARLGDPWPSPPENWGPGDPERAARYLTDTEVVIWTPGRQGGRPLSFQPLPDFGSVRDDPDEFIGAVDAAVASLVPRANVTGANNKARWSRAVLREALTHYARRGERSLERFIALLADLPEGVSTLDDATKLAGELAKSLRAAKVNDALFGGAGAPVDPSVLLTPSAGRKARISVISFIGLPSDEQRQSFVNQLQLELFAWIKNNPAGDRPLGSLLVMDEAQIVAPSGAFTPSTQSTLMLAAQARKYGLGLVFATQKPKGLNNSIPGNASTLVIGQLNAPVQIQAAEEMAQAKGGHITKVGGLKPGYFYAASEGSRFQRLHSRMCLSHHPKSALTPEDVARRAKINAWPDRDPDAG
ncbi:helicase HerA domain-containing protein [Actinophytocola sp.]|uniref:helicase HerA domain-containing protein n=1 Tax=Actinophytocola sp. TaxID=1872138 RepID=UPI002EDAEF4E